MKNGTWTTWTVALGLALLLPRPDVARADIEGDPARGGQIYRNCAACHSLQPGVHLSGPSLAGLWGRKAGSAEGFDRYSHALMASDMVWDENTLNAWLAHPELLVPGNMMAFRGIENDSSRANMIAFLHVAMGPDGYDAVLEQEFVSRQLADGQVPPSLGAVGTEQIVVGMRHCGDGYFIATADGVERPYWETSVRLKIDGSPRGPGGENPVIIPSGMQGDRVSVVFSSLQQIATFVLEQCQPAE